MWVGFELEHLDFQFHEWRFKTMSKKLAHLKAKAVEMYGKGATLPEICDRLNKGKGTIHYWLKDVPKRPRGYNGPRPCVAAASAANKARAEERRVGYRAEAQAQVQRLRDDPQFRDFVMLYLTEGTRKCKAGCTVAVANSNPNIIRLATKFIRELTGKIPQFCLQFHVDQDPTALAVFWADVVGTVPDLITFQRKSNSGMLGKRNWASHYGVLTVRTSSVRVRTMLGVWMEALQTSW